MDKKHFLYRYRAYAILYFIFGILIHFVDLSDFRGGGGSGGLIVLIGVILAALLKGELGRWFFSIIAFICGCAYFFKAKKYKFSNFKDKK